MNNTTNEIRSLAPKAPARGFRALLILFWLPVTGMLAAEAPTNISNAKLSLQPAAADFQGQLQALLDGKSGPFWIGYEVPLIEGYHMLCCGHSYRDDACHLEAKNKNIYHYDDRNERGGQEAQWLQILMRAENGKLQQLRVFSESCPIQGDGAAITWLTGAKPEHSIAMLEHLVNSALDPEPLRKRVRDGAVAAIAMHRNSLANDVLEQFTGSQYPSQTRRNALFWLGNSRAEAGYQAILRLLQTEPGGDLRKHATFALSVNKADGARQSLMDLATNDHEAEVRKQALFWVAQKGGKEVVDLIRDRMQNGETASERKQAVFVLTLLPEDGGVPALAELAQTHPRPELREEAVFWLGQKGGENALPTILEILARDEARSVRKKALFALSQLPDEVGVEPLIEIARAHEEKAIRGEALFWLGQKAGEKATAALERAVAEDPDVDIKEKAVFALSQLPAEEGVPLLIKIARTHEQPRIRKKAIFWLGQSKDPRALELFEQILLESK